MPGRPFWCSVSQAQCVFNKARKCNVSTQESRAWSCGVALVGVVVVLALADVRSLLGGFAMQSRQRFVRQPPLPIDDFFYVMVPGFI